MLNYKQTICNKILLVLIIFLASVSLSFSGKKVNLKNLELNLNTYDYPNMGIIIWDQRPQTINQKHSESILGYRRSITGIAYPQFTKSKESLSNILLSKIINAYNISSDKIINTYSSNNENKIKQKILNSGFNKVLVIKLNKLHFDGAAKLAYHVNIDITLVDKNYSLIYNDLTTDLIEMGSSGKYKKTVPATLKTIFENILNSTDLITAVNKEVTPEENVDSLPYDLVIKKNGDEIKANVLEISDHEIKYKLQNNLDGATRILKKTEIFMIKYKDGFQEVFK